MTLFDGPNAAYAQEIFERYARNPASVPEEWRAVFEHADAAVSAGLMLPEALSVNGSSAPVAAPAAAHVHARSDAADVSPAATSPSASTVDVTRLLSLAARAAAFAQAFRDHGHQLANLDPLGSDAPGHPQLDPGFFGTTLDELSEIPADVVFGGGHGGQSLADKLTHLRDVYCGTMGFQFEHMEDPTKVRWLWEEVESARHTAEMAAEDRRALLRRLSEVEGFEQFLHKTYLGQKRFSIEGNDTMVPMLDLAIELAGRAGGREVMIGMAHRGRLNVLTHVLDVPYPDMLAAFEGGDSEALSVPDPGTGDVKYHMGRTTTRVLPDGGEVRVRLAPNPSHLEFVNPVVNGMVRWSQFGGPDKQATQDTSTVVPVVIHGDAAFAAEGVVAETLNLARLAGYTTGGTIHIIANNQIGFTTVPEEGRSTRYSSDLAKGYDVPIIHVNADDAEACLSAVRLAMAYRETFHDDILIDLIGYRRHGHNEGDEPAYTQPMMYERIRNHPTARERYAERLVQAGALDASAAEALQDEIVQELRGAQDEARALGQAKKNGNGLPVTVSTVPDGGVPLEILSEINSEAYSWPDDFTVHPKLAKQLSKRHDGFSDDTSLDWAYGEVLAFGSLLREGIAIRLTGQDAERGTFSHRHLVLHDVETGAEVTPIAAVGSARLEVFNSPLTETACMGFEYGYSVVAGSDLILWEAQFGDFGNVAQVIVDQFMASGHAKWNQSSGLTLLLPHGYEGQGPEHSSARLERYLQACAEDNMIVAYPTTPAQYFHLLRRQAHTAPKRPLIVMSPKSLLRLPAAASTAAELTRGGFQSVIDDPRVTERSAVQRVVLCSGKFYYDLPSALADEDRPHVAIVRVEELYPFPAEELERLVASYPSLAEVVWAQEEPRNMGALSYIGPRLRVAVPRSIPLRHVSRPERASPAEGKLQAHRAQQDLLVAEALTT